MSSHGLLHVLGGGPWQLPTVQLAKAMGYRVLVTDPGLNRPAFAHADIVERVDITDMQATLEVGRRHRIDGILSDTSDWGVVTAAHVADALGLPGIGTTAARNCTDKSRMRQAVAQAGLPSPASALVTQASELTPKSEHLGLPLIVKPVDNQSGHGVTRVDAWADLPVAYEAALAASRKKLVQIERCLQGTEIIADGLVTDGRCTVLSVAVKTPYPDNPTVASRILYPAPDELPAALSDIHESCRLTTSALGLNQGLFHAEFIVEQGAIHPIDIAARGGGVHIYRCAAPHVSGVDLNRAAIQLAMGVAPVLDPIVPPRCANIEFFRLPPGEILAIDGVSEARAVNGVAAVQVNVTAGDLVGPLSNKDQRPGYIVSLGGSSGQVVGASLRAKALLRFTLAGYPGEISAL